MLKKNIKEKIIFIMKNQLYKLVINDVTDHCYKNCLNYFPNYSVVMDVGIGNGLMMKKYHSLIKSKNLNIIGIDINKEYLNHCNCLIRIYQLEDQIKIYHQSVESYRPPKKQYFDFILFSMSFMLFNEQHLVLDRIKNWLKPGGKIVFFQTMWQDRARLIEFIKLQLKYITTVDFGKVTYEKDFFDLLNEKNLSIVEDRAIEKNRFKGEYRMIVTSVDSL